MGRTVRARLAPCLTTRLATGLAPCLTTCLATGLASCLAPRLTATLAALLRHMPLRARARRGPAARTRPVRHRPAATTDERGGVAHAAVDSVDPPPKTPSLWHLSPSRGSNSALDSWSSDLPNFDGDAPRGLLVDACPGAAEVCTSVPSSHSAPSAPVRLDGEALTPRPADDGSGDSRKSRSASNPAPARTALAGPCADAPLPTPAPAARSDTPGVRNGVSLTSRRPLDMEGS